MDPDWNRSHGAGSAALESTDGLEITCLGTGHLTGRISLSIGWTLGLYEVLEYFEIGTINEAFYEDRYGVEPGPRNELFATD